MTEFVQNLINALALGGGYALLALGLAMVYSIFGLVNFAHGELITIAAYVLYWMTISDVPFVLAVVVAIAAGGAAAVLMERIAFRPLRGASVETLIISSFAVSIVLQICFQDFIGARGKSVSVPGWLNDAISVGGLTIGVVQLVAIAATVLSLLGVTLYLTRTRSGLGMRAAAVDFATTRLMGISANRVVALAFLISGILAGVSAVLIVAQRGTVDPLMGSAPILTAFVAVILGGLGNLRGAVIGGFVLGAIEIALQSYLPTDIEAYSRALLYALVIAVLIIKPHGLTGDRAVASSRV